MADNIELDAGSGGATVAADDVGGVHYQVVKLDVGGDGASAPVSNSNPVPVSDAGGTLTVDGTVAVTNAGLTELAAAINASSQMDVNIAASNATVAVSNAGLTELAAAINASSQLDVNLAASNATITVASHAVTNAGTFATQVDGAALTALQLLDNIVAVEDAVAGSGFSGVPFLAVRQDSHSDLAADGDFIAPTIDADGGLRVSIVAGAGSGGTASADDADFTAGTTSGTPAMGVYESSPSSVTDGDLGTVGITQTRAMKVAIDSGGITGRAEDAAHSTGHEGVVMLAVRRDSAAVGSDTDGDYSTINVDASGRIWANVANTVTVASHAVTNAGTFAVQAAAAGVAADDAAVSGNPVLNAGYSIQTDGTDPGTVSAEGDVATLRTDMQRTLLVNQTNPRFWHVSADYSGAQTNTSVKAAPGASLSLYLTDLVLSNGATAGNITLLDGSGGTVLFEIYPAINGGITLSLRNPIKLTANTALCITSTTVTTHSIFVSGYIAP